MSRRRVKNINFDEHDYDENEAFGYSLDDEPTFASNYESQQEMFDLREEDFELQNGMSKVQIQVATPSRQVATVGGFRGSSTVSAVPKYNQSLHPTDSKSSSNSSSPSIPRRFGSAANSSTNLVALDTDAAATKAVDPEIARKAFESRKELLSGRDIINMVVIGHVDAGKSTLMGHLLYQLGSVSSKIIRRYEQDCKKLGKQSFQYAWVLDESEEERQRGVTMDVAHSQFVTPTKTVNLLDCPGHRDFIPNMLTGAMAADCALLVVNATNGEFETGFDTGGQTREHAILVRSLGFNQIIVVINKMDTVDWSKQRFQDITDKLSVFLRHIGLIDSVKFCPASGLEGNNLTTRYTSCDWYDGPCLVELIDLFKAPVRSIDKPVRFFVSEVFKGTGNTVACYGSMSSGYMSTSDKVVVLPANQRATVKNIQLDSGGAASCTFAGDSATVSVSGVDMNHFLGGSVISSLANQCPCTIRLRAKILVLNVTQPITKGYQALFHHQNINVPVTFTKLVSQISKSTGQVEKRHPRCILKNCCAEVELQLERLVCIETYTESRDLGKFMIRERGVTIAAGTVTSVKSGLSDQSNF